MAQQKTLKNTIQFSGVGLHTGEVVNVCIQPAELNHGIKFCRVDLPEKTIIRADVSRVSTTNRGTTIAEKKVKIATVEHLLSALYAKKIDNALIEIDGEEVPILDGSSKPFVEMILDAGLQEQDGERTYFEISEPIHFKEGRTEISAYPSDKFDLTVMIDFDSEAVGMQYAEYNEWVDYSKEISPSRTFVFLHELEQLNELGLIKGGNIDNAIIIANEIPSNATFDDLNQKLDNRLIRVDKAGVINKNGLQFPNEMARHKLLDLIGDLSLVGKRIKGKIVAKRPGHKGNIGFAQELKKMYLAQRKLKGLPKYDPNEPPVYDLEGIKNLIPHRHPFLLVDKIIELTEDAVVGIKNVSFDQAYFAGHFPGNPVFPGVLQIEALAQTGGVLALSRVPDPENWDTYFIKIEKTRFKQKVVPGDTLILKMELLSPIRRGICHMFGTAYVGDKIVSEGELTAQIVNRTV